MSMGAFTSKHPLAGKRVVVLAGPTAVGKSALALRLCELLQGELISVDSVQVYRNLEIGANKPSAAEQARVRHHLIDLHDPMEEYTAGAFYRDALNAVEDVLSRGRLPVLCGGTSMYLRWLTRGRPDAPKADPVVEERVRGILAPHEAASDWPAGLARLEEINPSRAAQLSKNDWYRLHRALTVALQTDGPIAAAKQPSDLDGLDELRDALDMRCFFLCAPRELLCRRIDERCEAMLQKGLLEETRDNLLAGQLLPSSPAGRAIGYRQALAYLTKPSWIRQDAGAIGEFVRDFTAVSRRYAGQQTKWFRSEPSFEWVAADWDVPEAVERLVVDRIQIDRPAFDLGLTSTRQAELRAHEPAIEKAMRTYQPKLPATIDNPDALEALLERADACREGLEPRLSELLVADDALAQRFPYHRRETEYGAGGGGKEEPDGGASSPAGTGGAAAEEQTAKRAKGQQERSD